MKARRLDDEMVTIAIPRSALTVVAAPPATVTQRNCLEEFGISHDDYLKMAGRKFPVTKHGKLRVARYADVEAALTSGLETRSRRRPAPEPEAEPSVKTLDLVPALLSLGFKPRK